MATAKPKSRKRPPTTNTVNLKPILPIIARMLKTTRDVSQTERRQVQAALDQAKD